MSDSLVSGVASASGGSLVRGSASGSGGSLVRGASAPVPSALNTQSCGSWAECSASGAECSATGLDRTGGKTYAAAVTKGLLVEPGVRVISQPYPVDASADAQRRAT
ncbi:hypothetical protein SALBM217S_06420 [Streptomyces griseoloalbus]